MIMAKKMRLLPKNLMDYLAYTAICVGVIVVVLLLNRFDIFDKAEFSMQDMRFRIRGVESTSDDIVIVAIDPMTLDQLGLIGVPPRRYHVPLIENLYRAGAKAVLFDVLFLVYRGEYDPEMLGPRPSADDSLLAETFFFYPNTVIARKIKRSIDDATEQSIAEPPLPPPLFQNPDQLAFVDMIPDSDSFVRRARLFSYDMGDDKGWQYSYALRAAMFAMDADTAWIDTDRLVAHVGDREIPLENTSPPSMRINFSTDEPTFARNDGYISYEQIIDPGEFGIEYLIKNNRLKDKVVLVGATFPESKDWEQTPFYLGTKIYNTKEYPMYGVHIHKNIADTILNGRFIPPTRPWQFILLIIFMSIVATLINARFRGFLGLFLCVGLILLYVGVSIWLFIAFRRLIPVAAPAFAVIVINYISVVTYNYLTEHKQKAMIKGAFSQYVPGSVVDELIKNPDMLTLGGEERVMTVIFSDVAGFTTISESLSPTELVELLNEYLTAMTNIVFEHNGIIDKYEGDAIMAEFGAPLPDADHALKACLTAIEMQEQLASLREKFHAEGKPELRARVGINSGPMVVGNMGSNQTFDYTVMGDNVNLSSRLEGANKAYGTYIMCSEATRQMVQDAIVTRELDLLRVKGKTEGVLVHEIIGKRNGSIGKEKMDVIDVYLKGLEAYKDRRWDDGITFFSNALEIDSSDGPSKVYLDRCREFKDHPPPDDWDGIFTMRTK